MTEPDHVGIELSPFALGQTRNPLFEVEHGGGGHERNLWRILLAVNSGDASKLGENERIKDICLGNAAGLRLVKG